MTTIKEYLEQEINEEKLSHAFLVETNDCKKTLDDIYQILSHHKIIPKITVDNNPTIKIITADNNLIDKSKILEIHNFLITKSTYSKYKVYFILEADKMNTSAVNKLLKILEEPKDNIIGFLVSTDTNIMLPTIKSRCIILKNTYQDVNTPSDNNNITVDIINLGKYNYEKYLNIKKEILNYEKNNLIEIIKSGKQIIKNEISASNNYQNLAKKYKLLDNIIELINKNVSLELCIDKMYIEMRYINGSI